MTIKMFNEPFTTAETIAVACKGGALGIVIGTSAFYIHPLLAMFVFLMFVGIILHGE